MLTVYTLFNNTNAHEQERGEKNKEIRNGAVNCKHTVGVVTNCFGRRRTVSNSDSKLFPTVSTC